MNTKVQQTLFLLWGIFLFTTCVEESGLRMKQDVFCFSNERLTPIVTTLKGIEEQHPFMDEFCEKYGTPLWDYTDIWSGNGETYYWVPLYDSKNPNIINTIWFFLIKDNKMMYAPIRRDESLIVLHEQNRIFDILSYDVFGNKNASGFLFPKAPSTKAWVIEEYDCRDKYVGYDDDHLTYQGTVCKKRTVWKDSAEDHITGGSTDEGGTGEIPIGGVILDPPEKEKIDPCIKAKAISKDNDFQNRIYSLYREVYPYRTETNENGWIKTNMGVFIKPSKATPSSIAYDWSQIKACKVTEWFHSHPGSGTIPSMSDLEVLALKYNQGYISANNFIYGIVTEFGCLSLLITSEDNFKEFANKVINKDANMLSEYYELIKLSNCSPEEKIANFLDFLHKYGAGLEAITNMRNQITETWQGWQSSISENGTLNKKCPD